MKDEIKEILKNMKEWSADGKLYFEINDEKAKLLYNYITNLQEENIHLDKVNCQLRKKNNNDIYKSRNEKTIEYINNKWKKDKYYEDIENCMTFCLYDKDDLLNILQGDDKE